MLGQNLCRRPPSRAVKFHDAARQPLIHFDVVYAIFHRIELKKSPRRAPTSKGLRRAANGVWA